MSKKKRKKRNPIETLQGLLDMGAKECVLTREEAQLLLDMINNLQDKYYNACEELILWSEKDKPLIFS